MNLTRDLSALTALSPSDIWAVGGDLIDPVSERWDGVRWTKFRVPSPLDGGTLNRAAGTSQSDVWAVGTKGSGSLTSPLIERWDGTAWRLVPSPRIGYASSRLNDVAAVSPHAAWTVGWAGPEALAERWDGLSWVLTPVPRRFSKEAFVAVSADAPNDVWAVGDYGGGNGGGLIGHWNGASWSVFAQPVLPGNVLLDAVHAFTPNDVWVSGIRFSDPSLTEPLSTDAFVIRWDGRQWSLFNKVRADGLALGSDLSAASSGNVWWLTTLSGPLEHWNGSVWVKVASPSSGPFSTLTDVTAVGGDAWILGSKNVWRWMGEGGWTRVRMQVGPATTGERVWPPTSPARQ